MTGSILQLFILPTVVPNSINQLLRFFFSIVLLVIVDYCYRFDLNNVGCQGRISDGGVYRNSLFYRNNLLDYPANKPIPVSDTVCNLLTPMKHIFNFQLSRGGRETEKAFGILTNCFRVFTTTMCLNPEKAKL